MLGEARGYADVCYRDRFAWENKAPGRNLDTALKQFSPTAALNWSAIDVSIFGTLFERGLDPSKRSQLGAHYTDDTTFGVLSSRIHVAWAISCGSTLEDRPGYNTKVCFLPFPFPVGLTPADTAHQRTETLESGAVIPADILDSNRPLAPVEHAQAATKTVASIRPFLPSRPLADRQGGWAAEGSAQVKEEPAQRAGDTEQNPLPPNHPARAPTPQAVRNNAIAIAIAAKRLNDLRDNWLNPQEWTDRVPEVTPLGMNKSPYPDRILPKPGHEKDLAERTLTKLYNQRPAWLDASHKAFDMAVAQAYGWSDYTAAMPDEEILKRLLALNLERTGGIARDTTK